MDYRFLISFGIGLVLYLLGLVIFVLVKRYKNKRKFQKEIDEKENGGGQDE